MITPWPAQPPAHLDYSGHGWLLDENKRVLSMFLNDTTKTIVEVGTWLGLSARFMLDRAPNATLFAVDHWNGLPLVEWKGFGLPESEWKKLAPDPWAQFVKDSWGYRGRLRPVRADSWAGLDYLATLDLKPDLVYIDGGHGYERALGDIQRVRAVWPKAIIVGDDWTWPGVRQAVTEFFANPRDPFAVPSYRVDGNVWWVEP
jgi:hypothetical protein